ncbi:rare lipoprotein A [Devosia enhydra]|uniref:Endolytic peptidoglycan transglycosylase RlpA n=2 Tax=Devosia enhydra TaxID=665118 RepID=A0A1K2HUT2_9HYPH|nr:rare lipoprotein A [Devosia enhydra]
MTRRMRFAALAVVTLPLLAACGGFADLGASVKRDAFSSKEFGVKVSPRVTSNPNPPRGGGRYLVGKPYTVRGKVYTPSEDPSYEARGQASWYGSDFHGRLTANGEIFSANAITAAHPTMPLPSYARVTNTDTGRSVLVRVNDRGPYMSGRVIDLSHRAAEILGYVGHGVGNVHVQYVGPAPLEGDDTRMLMASVDRQTTLERGRTMIAMVDPSIPQPQPMQGQGPGNLGDMARGMFSMFGYADGAAMAPVETGAASAASAMASGTIAPPQGEAMQALIGSFAADKARETAMAFARLAAVELTEITQDGTPRTQVSIRGLKPGVDRADVLALASELGLGDIVLY